MDFVFQAWFGGLAIPSLMIGVGGLVKWILHGGAYPKRDHFLVGIELSMMALTLALTSGFEWFRQDFLAAKGLGNPAPLLGALALTQGVVALVALFIVLGAMRHYVDVAGTLTGPDPAISYRRWLFINVVGAAPLGIALYTLLP